MFEISKESNFVILNNGIYGFGPCKINGYWWEPDICDFITDWFSCHAWLFIFCPMTCLKLFFNCALTSLFDKRIVARHPGTYVSIPIPVFPYTCFDSPMCMIVPGIHCFPHQLQWLLYFISRYPTLGT